MASRTDREIVLGRARMWCPCKLILLKIFVKKYLLKIYLVLYRLNDFLLIKVVYATFFLYSEADFL